MSTILQFKTRNRDRLFFDQFQYALRCEIPHITAIRNYTGDFATDSVHTHRMLEMMKRWHSHVHVVDYEYGTKNRHMTPKERDNVLDFLSRLCAAPELIRTSVSGGVAYIYGNNLDFLTGLTDSDYIHSPEITEVYLDRPRDTVMLKKSNYQYRTYFRDCNITSENRQYLHNWIRNQQDIRVSPGLQEWLTNNWRNLYSNYFFDHNDIRLTQMLGLILPRALKATKTIVIAAK